MDFSRLGRGEALAGMAGLALIVFMFLPWFSVGIDLSTQSVPDVSGFGQAPEELVPVHPGVDDEVDAWDGLSDFDGFLIAAAGVAGMALALLTAAGRRLNLGDLPRGCLTAALGSLAVALILWRMLSGPGDVEFGIFLGLLAAIGVAVGAILALEDGGVAWAVPTTGRAAGSRTTRGTTRTARAPAKKGGSRSSSRKASGSSSGRKQSGRSSGGRGSSGGGRSPGKGR